MVVWFKGLPWYIQIGLGLLVLLILYFFIYKPIVKKINSGNYNAPVNESQNALNQLAQQGVHPTYGEAEYATSANSLETVLTGCTLAGASSAGWGIIKGIFEKMKNDADVYALIKAYGVRTTDKCGLFTGDLTGDLATTLTEHFSGSEQFLIRHSISDINDILKKNSIVFTF